MNAIKSLPTLPKSRPRINVVLFEPKIHWNTGNIGRTCLGLNARLHLIKPYGFNIDDKSVRRAGLDYWKHVKLKEYDNWNDFKGVLPSLGKAYFFTKFARNSLMDTIFDYGKNLTSNRFEIEETTVESEEKSGESEIGQLTLIFGSETEGLTAIKDQIQNEELLYIPQDSSHIRSFNLSNSVTIALWEAHRQYYHNKNH
eukprot:TRINITY_DN9515_c0_g1_i1.p1 TRINITY_DN9515_c0_g1~~TRINITY_DN9515_c0_g1_i1.p1  ORF type:complete len:199 (+),score=32.50 TRINITY_DN9515_c0_g1_i1:3-599(+)